MKLRVTAIPIVVGALGTILKDFEKRLEGVEIRIRIDAIHTTSLLSWDRILRRALES